MVALISNGERSVDIKAMKGAEKRRGKHSFLPRMGKEEQDVNQAVEIIWK